jgi:ribosomal protein L16/L10AE
MVTKKVPNVEKMTREEIRAYMQTLHAKLREGKITREAFEAARAPVRRRIEREF